MELFGLRGVLDEQGMDLNLNALLIISAVVGMTGSFISLALSKTIAIKSTGAKIIKSPANPTEAWLVETVTRQAREAGIGMPDVAIYDSPDMNAFATGMKKNSALVAVSSGLMQQMNQDQAEAVLAHEISHVANGDMITLTLIQGVVNTFVFFLSRVIGHVVDRVVFKVQRGHGPAYWITAIVAQIILGILASAIVMWFSRNREFKADAGGGHLAGNHKMISALQRLKEGVNQPHLPDQLQAFGISGGFKKGISHLFMSHPPLDDRIHALQHMG
jgi:heat shock protein HtpX